MVWNDEEKIKHKMRQWLNKNGFSKKVEKENKIHGVDIQRRNKKRCRYWFIECKGSPSKKYKKGSKTGKKKPRQIISSQRYDWFTTVIGQIALRMKQKHGKYGVAFPYDNYFRDKILDKGKTKTCLKIFRKRTKIHFFLVDKDGGIFQLTPNAKAFKKV